MINQQPTINQNRSQHPAITTVLKIHQVVIYLPFSSDWTKQAFVQALQITCGLRLS
jgi:hypothetical protein